MYVHKLMEQVGTPLTPPAFPKLERGTDSEVYEHFVGDFDVLKMKLLMRSGKLRYGYMEYEIVSVGERWFTKKGAVHHHFRSQFKLGYALSLPRSRYMDDPGILLTHRSKPYLIIDGNHRLAARYIRGIMTMRFLTITLSDARKAHSYD